jgi:hypothetical protein
MIQDQILHFKFVVQLAILSTARYQARSIYLSYQHKTIHLFHSTTEWMYNTKRWACKVTASDQLSQRAQAIFVHSGMLNRHRTRESSSEEKRIFGDWIKTSGGANDNPSKTHYPSTVHHHLHFNSPIHHKLYILNLIPLTTPTLNHQHHLSTWKMRPWPWGDLTLTLRNTTF